MIDVLGLGGTSLGGACHRAQKADQKIMTYLLFDDGDAATAVKTHVLPAIKREVVSV